MKRLRHFQKEKIALILKKENSSIQLYRKIIIILLLNWLVFSSTGNFWKK